MILKPFSNHMNISYKDFLLQNYFIAMNNRGLKKINLKGINIISKENDQSFTELREFDLIRRNFNDFTLTPELVSAEEKPLVEEIVNNRLAKVNKNGEQDVSFYNLGAAFSIEMFDIIWIFELSSDEIGAALESMKETLDSTGKSDVFEKWVQTSDKYLRYLENPADHALFTEARNDCEKCIEDYDKNLFAHFMLGLIYLKPTIFYNTGKAVEEFTKTRNISGELENTYINAMCDYMLAWIAYINSDYKKAITYSLSAIDNEFMNIPEIYYNIAKYYAADKDPENSIKYLDEAIHRFDFIYSVKADIDDDFKLIKPELVKYFIKLRDVKKNNLFQKLNDFGISFVTEKECPASVSGALKDVENI